VVCAYMCLLGIPVGPVKTDEPIEMPFEGQTRVGPVYRVLDGVHTGAI